MAHLFDIAIDLLFQKVQWDRAGEQNHVVEFANIEVLSL